MINIDFFSKVSIYRDDLNHYKVSGNKLHKLAPAIKQAKEKGCSTLLSFGGPYSNHLHALAWASKDNNLSCVGLIRGELHSGLTPTLRDCQDWGMRLISLDRKMYRTLQETFIERKGEQKVQSYLNELLEWLPNDTLVIPEGGSNLRAIKSLANAYRPIFAENKYKGITHVVCATGTGATVAGLYEAAPKHVKVIGVQAVSEGTATHQRIHNWLESDGSRISIIPGHLGKFAKTTPELLEFIAEFERIYDVPLDHVYNGKVLYKLNQMAAEELFLPSDQLLVIHTGGLQGAR